MGQTQGGNAGNLELLQKIKEQNEKKIFKTYLADSSTSLWDILKEIIKNNDITCTVIFNIPLESAFNEIGITAGIANIFYSTAYWRNHVSFLVNNGQFIYIGTINVENNTIDSYFQQASKNYVDKITTGTLTNGTEYNELIRNESETYYKSIKKNGKVVEFAFVFISKALVANKPYELFRVPYKPKSNLEVNIVSKFGRVLSFFCGASGAMVVMPSQAISDGDVIRLHATWITDD